MATQPETVAAAIRSWSSHSAPLVVAIDGHGASGKSTLADRLRSHLDVTVIHTDDFFRSQVERNGHVTDQPMARYYDAARLRDEVLVPLLDGHHVRFQAFDEVRDEFRDEPVTAAPSPVIVLEGVGSAGPELSDLVHRTILVRTPQETRAERLQQSVPSGNWDDDWLAAEHRYFEQLGPSHFDLTVSGSSD